MSLRCGLFDECKKRTVNCNTSCPNYKPALICPFMDQNYRNDCVEEDCALWMVSMKKCSFKK